jgi:hypothetical protein
MQFEVLLRQWTAAAGLSSRTASRQVPARDVKVRMDFQMFGELQSMYYCGSEDQSDGISCHSFSAQMFYAGECL